MSKGFSLEYWKRWQKTTNVPKKKKVEGEYEFNWYEYQAKKRQQDERRREAEDKKERFEKWRKKLKKDPRNVRGNAAVFGTAPQRPSVQKGVAADSLSCLIRTTSTPLETVGGDIGMAKREFGVRYSDEPGPGEYAGADTSSVGKQLVSTKRSIPYAKIAPIAIVSTREEKLSGVTAYDDGRGDLCCRNSVEAYTFSKGNRKESRVRSIAPGPGTYNVTSFVDDVSRTPFIGPVAGTSSMLELEDNIKHANVYKLRNVMHSSGYGHNCSMKDHLEYGVCIDGKCSSRGKWEHAVSARDPRALQYLGNERPAVHIAVLNLYDIKKTSSDCLKVLMRVNLADVDEFQRTVLHVLAAQEFAEPLQQVRKVRLIFEACFQSSQKIDINSQDADGNTPLHLAVQTEQTELVEIFLKERADPEIENNIGVNPLQLATELEGNQKIYQLLRAQTMMCDVQGEIEQIQREQRIVQSRRRTAQLSSAASALESAASGKYGFPETLSAGATPFGGLPSRSSLIASRMRDTRGSGTATSSRPSTGMVPFGGLPSRSGSSTETPSTLGVGTPITDTTRRHNTPFGGLPSRGS